MVGFMKEFPLSLSLLMGDGVNVPISTAIMPNLVWLSLLLKRQASYSSLE